MFDLAAFAPDFWSGGETREPNSALQMSGDFLSEDSASLAAPATSSVAASKSPSTDWPRNSALGSGRHFRVPISISIERFDDGDYAGLGPWAGWFSNTLLTFPETLRQAFWVHPQLDRQRPVVSLDDSAHPLSIAQEQGISPERLVEIYASYGPAAA